jgi:hypothetical protein
MSPNFSVRDTDEAVDPTSVCTLIEACELLRTQLKRRLRDLKPDTYPGHYE